MNHDLIATLWEGLRDAGLPEVMLYLPDGTASRCHWDDTAVVGGLRVALLGDQERGIVRLVPLRACEGIGVPAPKGVDPCGYRPQVRERLAALIAEDAEADTLEMEALSLSAP
jgi:hypothetical protein